MPMGHWILLFSDSSSPFNAPPATEKCIGTNVNPVKKMAIFTVACIKSVKLISHVNKLSNWVDAQIPKTMGEVVIFRLAPVSICSKGI